MLRRRWWSVDDFQVFDDTTISCSRFRWHKHCRFLFVNFLMMVVCYSPRWNPGYPTISSSWFRHWRNCGCKRRFELIEVYINIYNSVGRKDGEKLNKYQWHPFETILEQALRNWRSVKVLIMTVPLFRYLFTVTRFSFPISNFAINLLRSIFQFCKEHCRTSAQPRQYCLIKRQSLVILGPRTFDLFGDLWSAL